MNFAKNLAKRWKKSDDFKKKIQEKNISNKAKKIVANVDKIQENTKEEKPEEE